ncbi:MAG: hypothetical protein ABIH76_06510, partial [Candidatus Bathyarchaeota archaeon]
QYNASSLYPEKENKFSFSSRLFLVYFSREERPGWQFIGVVLGFRRYLVYFSFFCGRPPNGMVIEKNFLCVMGFNQEEEKLLLVSKIF